MTARWLPALTCLLAVLTVSCAGDFRAVVILPESGRLAHVGSEARKGIDLALAKVNEGREVPLVLEFADDGSDPERALSEYARAIESKALAVIGPVGGDAMITCLSARDERDRSLTESNVALISPWAPTTITGRGFENAFRNHPTDTTETGRLSQFMRRDMTPRIKDLVLISELSDYGRGYKAEFAQTFKRHQGTVESSMNFEPGITDEAAAELVAELKNRPGDGCLVVSQGQDILTLIKALRAIEYRGEVFTTSAFHHPELISAAGTEAGDVFWVAPQWDPTKADDPPNPTKTEFVAAYEQAHGSKPGYWAAFGYDTVIALAAGTDAAGGPYSSAIPSTLSSLNFEYPGVLGTARFDSSGNCAECPVAIYGISGGEVKDWLELSKMFSASERQG
ncbi:MAG: ABC transporter substrate-binding protein [Acidobacteriota bacterium]